MLCAFKISVMPCERLRACCGRAVTVLTISDARRREKDGGVRTILVTGGAGFIGSHYVRLCLKDHADVRVVNLDALTYAARRANLAEVDADVGQGARHVFVEGDIRDAGLVRSLLERYDVSAVVNFAAQTHVDRAIACAREFSSTNVDGVAVLLEEARRVWERGGDMRFVQVSTDEVYGPCAEGVFLDEEAPLGPRNPYAATKAAADMLALSFFHTHGLPVLITRSSNNFGPGQHQEKLICHALACAFEGVPVGLYGDGQARRNWLYVEDNCRAVDAVLMRGALGRIYNVAGSCELANEQVVRAVLEAARQIGAPVGEQAVEYVADRKGHDRRYGISAGRIQRELGWRAQVDFEEGLARTLFWFAANHPYAP